MADCYFVVFLPVVVDTDGLYYICHLFDRFQASSCVDCELLLLTVIVTNGSVYTVEQQNCFHCQYYLVGTNCLTNISVQLSTKSQTVKILVFLRLVEKVKC